MSHEGLTLISKCLRVDISVICACLGVTLGWCVSWRVARRIPREAN